MLFVIVHNNIFFIVFVFICVILCFVIFTNCSKNNYFHFEHNSIYIKFNFTTGFKFYLYVLNFIIFILPVEFVLKWLLEINKTDKLLLMSVNISLKFENNLSTEKKNLHLWFAGMYFYYFNHWFYEAPYLHVNNYSSMKLHQHNLWCFMTLL